MCSADESFAKTLGFAFSRGDSIAINTSTVVENQADLVEFILEVIFHVHFNNFCDPYRN